MRWSNHWDQYPTQFQETDYFRQVGKTVGGQPISAAQFNAIISDIHNGLNINATDFVMDLCCGNGIITSVISETCSFIYGVDYSKPLIQIADKHNKPGNVRYFNMSVLDRQGLLNLSDRPFTKIYMYEAMQHFQEGELSTILGIVRDLSTSPASIFFGSIPDDEHLWDFYNTPERKAEYLKRKEENQEAIGTWWNKQFIAEACIQNGFEYRFCAQNPILHTAHYRFDLCLTKKN